jgi:hypothetical protein
MSRLDRRTVTQATALAATWTIVLVALSVLWIRSPFLGTGVAFTLWSVPAAVVWVISWWWFRRRGIEQVPTGPWLLAAVALLWAGSLTIALTGIGARLALDGLILRQDNLRIAGKALAWAPIGFGAAISVAGLAASLEARYRVVRAPRTPSTPPDPGK